jgi:hypothetical protein
MGLEVCTFAMPSLYGQLYFIRCSSHGPLSQFISAVRYGYPICDVTPNRLNTSNPAAFTAYNIHSCISISHHTQTQYPHI